MKTTSRMRLRKFLLATFLCFTAYLSLAGTLFDLNSYRPFAG